MPPMISTNAGMKNKNEYAEALNENDSSEYASDTENDTSDKEILPSKNRAIVLESYPDPRRNLLFSFKIKQDRNSSLVTKSMEESPKLNLGQARSSSTQENCDRIGQCW